MKKTKLTFTRTTVRILSMHELAEAVAGRDNTTAGKTRCNVVNPCYPGSYEFGCDPPPPPP